MNKGDIIKCNKALAKCGRKLCSKCLHVLPLKLFYMFYDKFKGVKRYRCYCKNCKC